ncbi:MAG: putative Ig domain-containing protein [Woeseiaceae bacterium]
MNSKTIHNLWPIVSVLTLTLGGCLTSGNPDQTATTDSPTQNVAPTISGSPRGTTKIGEIYSFTPNASDADGDTLTFSIQGRPSWATFDSSDGSLSGIPTLGDVGTYSGIRISVSDGSAASALPLFSISVTQVGTGSVSLTWTAPTQNEDGTPLVDLAGYKIYYGVSQGDYPNQIRVDNPGLTSYVVDNLSPDTYFFVSTAFNSSGVESNFSNIAVRTVN